MGNKLVTNTFIRQGISIARGTTIDEYLTEADCERLYSRWDKKWEAQPIEAKGGIKIISCEMVLEIPEEAFIKSMGTPGKRIRAIALRNAGR